uniref:38858766-0526-413a-b28e-e2d02e624771-CDS n=1 Tax=Plasmodiophora brassicae TaxID=37360 RepID=A0A3P3YW91_PLABS|nr:38858766-0526-413a-b28e-e2d02e624771-CDS [Plasmodiophora brassicae]
MLGWNWFLIYNNSIFSWPKYWGRIERLVYLRQMNLAKLTVLYGSRHVVVQQYQNYLLSSLVFKLVAVRRVVESKDIKLVQNRKSFVCRNIDKLKLVAKLNSFSDLKFELVKYKIFSKFSKKKTCVSYVVTLEERAAQSLFNLILEPIVESISDYNNYGFRRHRSQQQAISDVYVAIQSKFKKEVGILKCNVLNFFTFSVSTWILKYLPVPIRCVPLLHNWLCSGLLRRKALTTSSAEGGVFVNGILTNTVINFILNNLEKKLKRWGRFFYLKSLSISSNLNKHCNLSQVIDTFQFIRYAGEFIIIGNLWWLQVLNLRSFIVNFLQFRGVHATQYILRLFSLKNENLSFLGYDFGYTCKNVNMFFFILFPTFSKFVVICRQLHDIFYYQTHKTAFELITQVNPLIMRWCQYYSFGYSFWYRLKLDNYLFKLCWNWARRKHPKWGKNMIAYQYFLQTTFKFSKRKWVFKGLIKNKLQSNLNYNTEIVYLWSPIVDTNCLSIYSFFLPVKFRRIHAFHSNIRAYLQWLM